MRRTLTPVKFGYTYGYTDAVPTRKQRLSIARPSTVSAIKVSN